MEHELRASYDAMDQEESALCKLVQKSNERSRLDVCSRTHWKWDAFNQRWQLLLKACPGFVAGNYRPFFGSLLSILKCHQDVQWNGGSGLLLRYVAGYCSKFGEGWSDEWVNTADTSFSAGLQLLNSWKPSEPQMVMTLSRMAMAFTNVETLHYRPQAFHEVQDDTTFLYRRRSSDESSLSLLAWLRTKVLAKDADGRLQVRRRKRSTSVAVAVQYYSFPKNDFFWQWMVMNVPHRLFTDLVSPRSHMVAPHLKHFASAIEISCDQWSSDLWVENYMRLQGHREDVVGTHFEWVKAARALCSKQIAGLVPKYPRLFRFEARSSVCQLNALQSAVLQEVLQQLHARDDGLAAPPEKFFFITGGPGTGKTYTCNAIISEILRREGQFLSSRPQVAWHAVFQCKKMFVQQPSTEVSALG